MADEAKVPIPPGVHPLFLTMSTQEKFACVEMKDCTSEKPYVYVTKKVFLDDIQFRGAISDFHPVKKQIEKYPDSEEEGLAIVWDENEDYGQNFYICLTVKAKDAVVEKYAALAEAAAAPGATGEGGGEGGEGGGGDDGPLEEYKPPEAKEWVSQGSEAEIAETAVAPTRERFSVALSRKRREFGADPPGRKFSDRDSHDDPCRESNDCRQYKDPNFELRKRETDVAIQACAETSEALSQTRWFRPVNKTLQYEPRTMGDRERHDVLSSEAMRNFLATVRNYPCPPPDARAAAGRRI